MKPEFKNQVVLITGSSKGIGKSLAIHMGLRGARIGLNGRNADKLAETHSELKTMGIESLMLPGDATDYQDCERIVKELTDTYGNLDCVVANGSMMSEASIMEIYPEVFKRVIESQILGAVFPIKAALPALINSKGYVLIVSSLVAFHGLPFLSSYSMGKATQPIFAQSLRFELGQTGVDIGVAYVCFTKNEANKQMISPDGKHCDLGRRPTKMQFPREKVAKILARMILKRRKSKVLSMYGKTFRLLTLVAPSAIKLILKRNMTKKSVN